MRHSMLRALLVASSLLGGTAAIAAAHPQDPAYSAAVMTAHHVLATAALRAALDATPGGEFLLEWNGGEALRGHFRPEFLNRVDDTIVFKPLTRDDLRRRYGLAEIRNIKDLGPYLAAAGFVALLWGQPIIDAYRRFSGL